MLNDYNVMGRLAADPELRSTPEGTHVCSFVICCDRDRTTSDGERKTDFIDAVAWAGAAEFIKKHFHKGQLVAANGRMQSRLWEDSSGTTRKSTELSIEHIYFAGSKKENNEGTESN